MFSPNLLLSDNEKLLNAPNPMLYQTYLYFSKSAFLVNLTASNKEFRNMKSSFFLNDHKFFLQYLPLVYV